MGMVYELHRGDLNVVHQRQNKHRRKEDEVWVGG